MATGGYYKLIQTMLGRKQGERPGDLRPARYIHRCLFVFSAVHNSRILHQQTFVLQASKLFLCSRSSRFLDVWEIALGWQHPSHHSLKDLLKCPVKGVDRHIPVLRGMIVTPTFDTCGMNPYLAIRRGLDPNLKAFSRHARNIKRAHVFPSSRQRDRAEAVAFGPAVYLRVNVAVGHFDFLSRARRRRTRAGCISQEICTVLLRRHGPGRRLPVRSRHMGDATTPHRRLMVTILGGLAKFERGLIRTTPPRGPFQGHAARAT